MVVYGIDNVSDRELKFNYDKYYREVALNLKEVKAEDEKTKIRKASREKLESLLNNISIDEEMLKDSFINLLLDENSSKYLWILYSKYNGEENYIDKISDILKQENKVIRGGTNTYKMNGWMAHTLYVYQIANDNIAHNTKILNFNGDKENIKQVQELHELFETLSKESKFLLKIFALIHDIGVIEDIKYHDKIGGKYVEKVLKEIGLNQITLDKNNFLIDIKDFTKILRELIKYHTLITSLSSESSDAFVEVEYRNLIGNIPEVRNIKQDVPKILMLLAYGDVIAVDESLMDTEKYQRIKDCYNFFEQISQNRKAERNKEKVAIERICDMVGESKIQNLELKFNDIMERLEIDKKQFIEDMYNIKLMKYTGPLMKTLRDVELTIKIYFELFELIGTVEEKEELKNYTIIFVPDKHEDDFVEQFKNGNFFNCVKVMKNNKENDSVYGNISILNGSDLQGKYLYIRVV